MPLKKYAVIVLIFVLDYNLRLVPLFSALAPQIDLIAIYLLNASTTSVSIYFVFGVMYDFIYWSFVGVHSIIYVLIYTIKYSCNITRFMIFIKIIIFSTLCIGVNLIKLLLYSIYDHSYMSSNIITSILTTIACYSTIEWLCNKRNTSS